jgi:FAD:protein FMN transferase
MRKSIKYRIVSAVILIACVVTAFAIYQQNNKKNNTEEASVQIFAMDTVMSVSAVGKDAQEAVDAASTEINRLDKLLSAENKDSEIYQLNASGDAVVSEETLQLIQRAQEISKSTEGAFDITIYPLMQAWGFTTQNFRVPEESEIEDLLTHVGSDKVSIEEETNEVSLAEGTKIDLGGIAKGYTSAHLAELFTQYDLQSATISLGGNVQMYGSKTDGENWNIAIKDPSDPDSDSKFLGIVSIKDGAVITSGGYERYFEEDGVTYHHILDPSTGYPSDRGVTSVTIVSSDGTLADGLSTSLFVMGIDKASAYWRQHSDEFDFVIMTEEGKLYISEGLEGKFQSDYEYEVVKAE